MQTTVDHLSQALPAATLALAVVVLGLAVCLPFLIRPDRRRSK